MASSHEVESVETLGTGDLVALSKPIAGTQGGAAIDIAGTVAQPRIVMVEAARDQIIAEFPVRDGRFAGAVDLTGLGEAVRFRVRARFANGNRRPIAALRVRRTISNDDPGGAQPLVITSIGRSGSTYLAHLLLSHPAITGYPRYPYESHWMSHALSLRRLVVEAATTLTHERPSRLAWSQALSAIDAMPEASRSAIEARERAADAMARDMIRGAFDPAAGYILEKGAPINELRDVFAAPVEILLVRDPRDVFASILAFNAKRGFDDFGRQDVDSDHAFIAPFGERVGRYLQTVNRRARNGLVVRYEDLVERPAVALHAITSCLGVEDLPPAQSADPRLEAHKTSHDAAGSIGKWRRDLDPDLAAALDTGLADVVTGFGYQGGGDA